jgi:hypothetical protein
MSKIQINELCKKCGHPLHDHGGWSSPIEESELDEFDGHCDCKALIGWYCPTCKTRLKKIHIHVEHLKDGVLPDVKTAVTCPTCTNECFTSQCECFNYERG